MTAPSGIAERIRPETVAPASIPDQLRMPLRAYFELPADRMPSRLSRLLAAFESALSARGESVTAEFRDGLMQALPALRTFALSLTGDATRADDLVQETMLRAWTNHHRFAPGTRLIAWLFTIQRNLFYSEIRKRKREVEDADGVHAAGLTALAGQDDAVALRSLYQKLEHLPATQREALLLVGAEGFTYEEAAAILACRVGTVKSRVSRARTQLADLLGESRNVLDDAAA
ncbi:sigma-70 family RNA polymerase sigma factor [Methylobacterium sp. C25]|uniref:sigma-70 family RNA polymerase sigma factor n=1 Tax=Methylobacterium sp. C25 TaxID=2721622 RepID=UPI003FA38240